MEHVIYVSDFTCDFGKLPFPAHLGKRIIKNGKISTKIHEIGKIKTIFGLEKTPIQGVKKGQIKSLYVVGTQKNLLDEMVLLSTQAICLN